MRITGIQLASLAAVLAGGVSATDAAADTTISTATTTPLQTSSAGNVLINSGGSITVGAGQAAITVNSNNTITNAGQLSSADANNSTGILLGNGFGGAISVGNISLTQTYAPTDTDNDGILDGPFGDPTSTSRYGVLLGAGAAYTGDINAAGTITVEGQHSGGIRLDALLDGTLTASSIITVTGEESNAIAINGGVTGDVTLTGTVVATGQDTNGLLVDAPIGGALTINGNWTVTGFHNTVHPADTTTGADDTAESGSAIAVHSSVAGGVTIEGVGVETDAGESTVTASISQYGSAPAVAIDSDPSTNLELGVNSRGFGLQIRGAVVASGVYNGVDATGVRIQGTSTSTAKVDGGIAVDFGVTSVAYEANATGLYIGDNASTPTVLIRRQLSSTSFSETSQTAYGVYLASGANVPSLVNSGTLTAQLSGEIGNATAIVDHSNTLATITNYGTLEALIVQTDADPTDNIPPPPITGHTTAIDVSGSSIDVTYNQIADIPFTDDDSVDDDVNSRPAIITKGDILFGSGNDHLNLLFGEIDGNVSFGAGADTFLIDNGAIYNGRISDDGTGALTITLNDGSMTLNGGTTNITSATFGTGSATTSAIFRPALSVSDSTHLIASGSITFDSDASIVPIVPVGLPSSGAYTFLTANGGMFGATNVVGPVSGAGIPYVYNLNIALTNPAAPDGAPNSLEADFILKTPAQLGLNSNQTIAFSPIIAALQSDPTEANAFATISNAATFNTVYAELMPSFTSAATELATTAIQQEQSATTNRLASTRLHNLNEVSAWAQEIGYGLNRESPDANGQDFRGHGFGLATGIDGPLNNGALFGLSASFITSEAEEPARPDGQISSSFAQMDAYLGSAVGPVDLDFVGGLGLGRMRSRRFIEMGSVKDIAEGRWWAYEGHGMVRASAPMRASNSFVITPEASLTYVALQEQGYTENGASGLDINADSSTSQRLWADAGVDFSFAFHGSGQSVIAPRLSLGYRANVITDGGDRTFRFANGGSDFTLADDDYGSGGPVVGIGVDATNGYSTFSLSYEGEFSDQIERHSLNAALRYRF